MTQISKEQEKIQNQLFDRRRSQKARAQGEPDTPHATGFNPARLGSLMAASLLICGCSLSIPEKDEFFAPDRDKPSDPMPDGGDSGSLDASMDTGPNDGGDTDMDSQVMHEAGSDSATTGDAGGGSADAGQDSGPSVFEPNKGLVLHYPFNESSGDTVHNVAGEADGDAFMYGTPEGHEPWVSPGRVGGALSLAGGPPPDPDAGIPVGHHVELPDGILLGLEECTIALWVNRAGGPAWQRVFDFGSGLPNWLYFTPNGGTNVPVVAGRTPGTVFVDHTLNEIPDAPEGEGLLRINKPISVNTWVHFVLTWSANEIAVYMDGKLVAQTVPYQGVKPTDLGNTNQNYLGWSQFQPPEEFRDPFFEGMLDDFRLYNRVLSASDVEQLYDSY